MGTSAIPWLARGDFNEVLRPDEHEGVGERSNAQIQSFREAVAVCMNAGRNLLPCGEAQRGEATGELQHERGLRGAALACAC